jgi:formiminotetrahydrofolate cyclodeaminase
MAALLTCGSPKFSDVAARARQIGDAAQRLMSSFVACIDEDAAAFGRVADAYKLPKASEVQKRARSQAIQEGLLAAADPPLRVIELAREVSGLAAELVGIGNPNVASDVGCAALCAHAAAHGGYLNVNINVKSLKDRAAAQDYAGRSRAALAQVDLLTEVVLGKVQAEVLD